jgi:hypothetical protein
MFHDVPQLSTGSPNFNRPKINVFCSAGLTGKTPTPPMTPQERRSEALSAWVEYAGESRGERPLKREPPRTTLTDRHLKELQRDNPEKYGAVVQLGLLERKLVTTAPGTPEYEQAKSLIAVLRPLVRGY